MIFDAVILAGGRSSRLGGTPKSGLVLGGSTLLGHTVDAVQDAARIVIVGDNPTVADALVGAGAGAAFSPTVTVVREQPLFAGPAAAIAAGVDELARTGSAADWVFVLACDVPGVAEVVGALRRAGLGYSEPARGDGFVAADESGHPQLVLGLYRAEALARAVDARRPDGFAGLSVRELLGSLTVTAVQVPTGSTDDVDTWNDAVRVGIVQTATSVDLPVQDQAPSPRSTEKGRNSDEELAALRAWHVQLCHALGVDELPDVTDDVLRLAGIAAHALVRPAAPLTTFIAGYAAGVAAANGQGVTADQLRLVLERAERATEGGIASVGGRVGGGAGGGVGARADERAGDGASSR